MTLRSALVLILHQRACVVSVAELVEELDRRGIQVTGRVSKRISDLLRTEMGHGRVQCVGRGRYRATRWTPRTTLWRMRQRVAVFPGPW